MYIKEELRLNKFVCVSVPAPRDYFQRLGAGEMPIDSYGGDEQLKQGNKVDNLALMEERDKQIQNEEAKASEE